MRSYNTPNKKRKRYINHSKHNAHSRLGIRIICSPYLYTHTHTHFYVSIETRTRATMAVIVNCIVVVGGDARSREGRELNEPTVPTQRTAMIRFALCWNDHTTRTADRSELARFKDYDDDDDVTKNCAPRKGNTRTTCAQQHILYIYYICSCKCTHTGSV